MPPKLVGVASLGATPNTSSVSSTTPASRSIRSANASAAPAPKPAYIATLELPLLFCGVFTLSPGHEFVTAIYNVEQKLMGKLFRTTDGTLLFVSATLDACSPEPLFQSVNARLLEFPNCHKFIFFTERTKERDTSLNFYNGRTTKIKTLLADIVVIQKTTTALAITSYLNRTDASHAGLTDDTAFEKYLKDFYATQNPSLLLSFNYQEYLLCLNTNDICGTHFQWLVRQLIRTECPELEGIGFSNICRNETDKLEVLVKFAREYITTNTRFAPLQEMAKVCRKVLTIDSLLQLDVFKAFQWFIGLLKLAGFTVEQPALTAAGVTAVTEIDPNIAIVVSHPFIKQGRIAIVRPHQHIGNEQDFKKQHQLEKVIPFNVKEHFFETIRQMLNDLGVVIENPENCLVLFQRTVGIDAVKGNPINPTVFGALADYCPLTTPELTPLDRHTSQLSLDPVFSLAILRPEDRPEIQKAKSSIRLATQAQYFDNQLPLNALTLELITIGMLHSNGYIYFAEKRYSIKTESRHKATLFNLHDYDSFDAFLAEFGLPKSFLKSFNHFCFIRSSVTTYPYVIFCENGKLRVYLFNIDTGKIRFSLEANFILIPSPDQASKQMSLDGFTQKMSELLTEIEQTALVDLLGYKDVSLSLYNQGVSLTNSPSIQQKNSALVRLFNDHKATEPLQQAYEHHQQLVHSCFKTPGLFLRKRIEGADGNHLAYVFKNIFSNEMALLLHPTDPSSEYSLNKDVITTAVNAALADMPEVTIANTKMLLFTVRSGSVKLAVTECGSQKWQTPEVAPDQAHQNALTYIGIRQDEHSHFFLVRPAVFVKEEIVIDIKLRFRSSSVALEELRSPLSPPAATIKERGKSVSDVFSGFFKKASPKPEPATAASSTGRTLTLTPIGDGDS